MTPISRRAILRGAAGTAIALPWLEAMHRPSSARAETGPPRRFVVFFNANGTLAERWNPTGSETSFSLSPILSPLEPHKGDIVVIQGVDMEAAKHGPGGNDHDKGMGCLLSATELVPGPSGVGDFGHLYDGSAGGITLDQEIAKQIGASTKFRSLELGVKAGGMKQALLNRLSYLGRFRPVPAENKPDVAFARIFGDASAQPEELARLRARRQSVLDSVKADFMDITGRVAASDRAKLDSHLTAIREIEVRLAAMPIGSGRCERPALGAVPTDYPAVGTLQMDLLIMALACDLTRVASLQWSTAQSPIRPTWAGVPDDHHFLSHAGDGDSAAKEKLMRAQQWYGSQFAYLVGKMKKVAEGSGAMLDSTLVLWCNELGRGNSHSHSDIPFVLAGRAGGALRTGRYRSHGSTSTNNLFVSILNLMGVPAKSFGNPAYCTGPLPGLA